MKNLILIFLFAFFLFSDGSVCAQSCGNSQKQNKPAWTSDPFEHFVFIENKGQFDVEKDKYTYPIFYKASSSGIEMNFHINGMTYSHDEYKSLLSERKMEQLEKEGKEDELKKLVKRETKSLQVEWLGSNPSATIITSEPQKFYYTYGDANDKTIEARTFKKITYKDLYPNIDVEYILPEKGGLKYSLILHPGADLSQVKMCYKNSKKLKTDRDGNIIIKSEFGDFVDHAPISFYADNHQNIISSFMVKNNIVSFQIDQPGTLNPEPGTIVIDPWTSSPVFPLNKAFDVNYDLLGNVYVYCSNVQFRLAKFNSAGVLQWTYTNPNANNYQDYGDFAVDEYTGTSYIIEAFGAKFYKINSSGQIKGTFTLPMLMGFQINEFWRCEYNRCLNKIVIGGGGTLGTNQAAMLDTNMSTLVPVNVLGATSPYFDIVSVAIDPKSAFCYMMTATPKTNPMALNMLIKCPIPNLIPTPFSVSNGYTFKEVQSVPYTPIDPSGLTANGFNGLACGPTYLYSYDGSILKKWNKNTGVLLGQVNTGGTMFASGGLSVDNCDNVYAGVGTEIKVYNSSLTQVAAYILSNTCYDLKLGLNNKLYACGNGFVSEIQLTPLARPTITSTPASGCNACNGTATVNTCGDPTGYSYLWKPGGQTSQSINGLCAGNYTVSIITNCTVVDTLSVSIAGGPGGIVLGSIQSDICSGSGTATATASGGTGSYSYTWSNGQNAATAINLSAGSYTVTATDAGGCSAFKVITIKNILNPDATSKYTGCSPANTGSITVNVPGNSQPYTYQWNNAQTTATITGLNTGIYTVTVTDKNGCTASLSREITYPPFDVTSSLTYGQCSPTASVNVTVGTPAYTYSWSNGATTASISGSNIATGTYTVTVTDGAGCTITKSFNLTGNPVTSAFTISPDSIVCVGTTVTFTPSTTTGTHDWQIWMPSGSTLATGSNANFSYTFSNPGLNFQVYHRITSGSCGDFRILKVKVINCSNPTVTTTGSSVCPGSCATISSNGLGGTGAYTYTWSNGATSQNISPCPVSTTTYTVTIKDGSGNTATSTAMVTINPTVSAATTASNITCSGASTGSATAAGSAGTPGYSYQWSNLVSGSIVSGLASGTYTVTVTDSKGCTATSTAAITSPPPLSGQFTKGTTACTSCGCKQWIMINATGGTSPYSYSWSAPGGYDKRYKNQLCPGAYTINIKDKNGCNVNVNLTAP